jgi:hypothetical protein
MMRHRRRSRRSISLIECLPVEDGGDVLGADAVKVQVQLPARLDCAALQHESQGR